MTRRKGRGPAGPDPGRRECERLLQQAAERVLYRSLDALMGRSVEIASPESVPQDILAALGRELPPGLHYLGPDDGTRRLCIVTHGLLDLTLEAPVDVLAGAASGMALLEDLGFTRAGDPEETWLLEELLDDAHQVRAYVRLFLTTSLDGQPESGILRIRESRRLGEEGGVPPSGKAGWRLGFPLGYWPRAFAIEAACVTNSQLVWFLKHFYG